MYINVNGKFYRLDELVRDHKQYGPYLSKRDFIKEYLTPNPQNDILDSINHGYWTPGPGLMDNFVCSRPSKAGYALSLDYIDWYGKAEAIGWTVFDNQKEWIDMLCNDQFRT